MSVDELITELEQAGIRLWEEDGRLRFRGPKGAMTDERKKALRAAKDEVLAALRQASGAVVAQAQPEQRHEPYPVTDVQAAYLLGRTDTFEYGGVACHGYVEIAFPDLDPARIQAAWNTLVRRHDALRSVVHPDGYQHVLREVPEYRIAVSDMRGADSGEDRQAIEAARADLAHQVRAPDVWPLFDLRVTLTDDRALLHVSIDLLIADYASIQLLLAELDQLYADPDHRLPDLDITFRDYVLAERRLRDSVRYQADRSYWMRRLDELPPAPELPVRAPEPSRRTGRPARFRRWETTLDAARWTRLKRSATAHGVTASGAVLGCYAEVIGRWSRRPRFTLDLTLLNRLPLHPHTDRLVGDFTSVSLLAVDLSRHDTFAQRARAMATQLYADIDHRLFSGVEVLREVARRRGRGAALMPIVFTSAVGLTDQRVDEGDLTGKGDFVHGISQTPQVWIDCQVVEKQGALSVNWDVREGVLPEQVVEDMFAAFAALLGRLADDPGMWDEAAPVALPRAQSERRRRVNDTAGPLPDQLLHHDVVAQARRTPDRTAVRCGTAALTYRQLLDRAQAVRADLAAAGCGRGDVVAVHMDKGPEQVVAVLGILLCGAAYLPVDTNQPPARRTAMLTDAGVRLVLTQPWNADVRCPDGRTLVVGGKNTVTASTQEQPEPGTHPDDLAYVIYTSGSSGRPKGVMISHRGALNTVADINRRFKIGPDDRVLALAHLGFDLSVYDLFGPLSVGGCLVIPDAERRADPSHWAQLVADHEVTVWNSVPAQIQMLHHYLESEPALQLPSLRLALLSGDWIPVRLPDQIRTRIPELELISLGGATEASIWSIFHPIGAVPPEARSIRYGKPLTNQTFHVLDHRLDDCPDWTAGELYIGGTGVALGYLGDTELTAHRFLTHPRTGQRLYRTGDLGRYLPDGDIEFLGRDDQQVKIRGHRIELGEVEAALQDHPSVAAAATVVREGDSGRRELVGFVAPALADTATKAERAAVDKAVAAAARRAATAVGEGADRDQVRRFSAALDRVALLTMADALHGAGLFATADETHALTDVYEALRATPDHYRLVRRWLRALEENDLVRRNTATGRYHGLTPTGRSAVATTWQKAERLQHEVGFGAELVRYLRISSEHLPALLAGEADPLHLLFPEGESATAEAAYRDNLIARYLNAATTAALVELAGGEHVASRRDPLRILEIGAGVGGTSTEVIPALDGLGVEYVFSDISPFFLGGARERFAAHPWVSYRGYDLNKEPRAQGVPANSFDVVLAANVLHYAHDIETGLARVRELLCPGGLLVFIDATRENYPLMTSVEFLEGGEGFDDVRHAQENMFLTEEQWLGLLDGIGAQTVALLPEAGEALDCLGQAVFVARVKTDRAEVPRRGLDAHLAQRLPEYMIPSAVHVVDEIPLSGNGKVDRKALLALLPDEADRTPEDSGEEPRTDLERRLAALWAQVLGRPSVGRDQNFFELGGDSLLAARLVGRMREELPEAGGMFFDSLVRELYPAPTVAGVAAHLSARAGTDESTADAGHPDGLVELVSLDGTGSAGLAQQRLTILVHDEDGSLERYGVLPAALSAQDQDQQAPGSLLGLRIADPDACLRRDPGDLVAGLAADGLRLITGTGATRFRIVGSGAACRVATELAHQLTENQAEVDLLALLVDRRPAQGTARTALAEHTAAAATAHEPALYAADITLLTSARDTGDTERQWQDVCLGDVRVVRADGPDDEERVLVSLLTGTAR
ncbi:amino acid adenylation domain-containing protein [Streptomyces sp. NPDC050211]|uniref:non-ribosomal peptide synthetase n=1 Tax=Streptomyces sp. NPDC050211 TaxID=3154932 RepID=UPI0034191956